MPCMDAPLRPTSAPDPTDLDRLSGEISAVMSGYCDAIEACRLVPRLSVLPLPKLYLQTLIWMLGLEVCVVLVPIDLVLVIARRISGHPRIVVGRVVYRYLAKPLQSVWDGEIPAFAMVHLRYLTRLLLFYRAASSVNVLHSVFNRRHLDFLFADPPEDAAVSKAEKFQKSFELFQKITTDSYQIGAIAIGGPFVALLTLALQYGFVPAIGWLWNLVGGPTLATLNHQVGNVAAFGVTFILVAVWMMVSAWMDMRSILVELGVPKIERQAYAHARIRLRRQVPFDILLYLGFVALGTWSSYLSLSQLIVQEPAALSAFEEMQRAAMIHMVVGETAVCLSFLFCLGLIALARRLWLSRF
jgi:hypothetical protein